MHDFVPRCHELCRGVARAVGGVVEGFCGVGAGGGVVAYGCEGDGAVAVGGFSPDGEANG